MFNSRDEHLGRLLQSAYRDFNIRAINKLHRMGYHDLTQFQAEIISYIELDGTRIKTLVNTTQTTKQAVGETVAQLVNAGYLKKAKDPKDGRAQLLRFTPLGEQFLLDAHRIKAELEQEYTTYLGRETFGHLQKALRSLAATRQS